MWYLLSNFSVVCQTRYFFGIPSWDRYLYPDYIKENQDLGVCEYMFTFMISDGAGGEKLNLDIIALIGMGILDILLRLGALVALGFVVYGGVQYVLSQGEPDRTKKALGTIVNALIGFAITVVAAAVVAFIGNRIGG